MAVTPNSKGATPMNDKESLRARFHDYMNEFSAIAEDPSLTDSEKAERLAALTARQLHPPRLL
jgi:hypothetical protein